MADPARFYTPAEAAAISGLALKAVNNAIDKHIVDVPRPKSTGGRIERNYLTKNHLVCFRLEQGLVGSLPVERRRIVFRYVMSKPAAMSVEADEVVTINVAKVRHEVEERERSLAEAERLIHSDKDTLAGEPVFKGTRISVYGLVAMLDAGATVDELVAGSSKLDAHKVDLARLWVTAHPRRGRPKRLTDYGFTLKSTSRRSLPADPLAAKGDAALAD
jgi:uncharacterized protein (DUF433 family)